MNAKAELQNYKKMLDRRLAVYFDQREKDARKVNPIAVQALRNIRDLVLAGGKRMRAAFMYWGYKAAGGREDEKIIEASMSIELTHIFLLIHDDIVDLDDFRHGVPTMHKRYEKIARRYWRKKKDPAHFGNSMAMIVGDMAAAAGNEIIFNSKFPPEHVLKALTKLQHIVRDTVSGEMMDIILRLKEKATEKEILAVHESKTAKYSIEGPLHLGALLAGADARLLDALSAYAVPTGIAFQIQDDILGVFGDEKKLGKPVCSDLREGIQTLLTLKAQDLGNSRQRKIVRSLMGKKDASAKEIRQFQDIVRDTGSLDYSRKLSARLAEKGKAAIQNSEVNEEVKEFLTGIADFIVSREV